METHRSQRSKLPLSWQPPFIKLVLRETQVDELATNGVAESAMREVKRQTRTMTFFL